jgi:hypothetical protein
VYFRTVCFSGSLGLLEQEDFGGGGLACGEGAGDRARQDRVLAIIGAFLIRRLLSSPLIILEGSKAQRSLG